MNRDEKDRQGHAKDAPRSARPVARRKHIVGEGGMLREAEVDNGIIIAGLSRSGLQRFVFQKMVGTDDWYEEVERTFT